MKIYRGSIAAILIFVGAACEIRAAPRPKYTIYQALELYEFYRHNEIKADLCCRNNWFVLEGIVVDIARSEGGEPYVDLVSQWRTSGPGWKRINYVIRDSIIRCYFSDKYTEQIAGLRKNGKAIIWGQCKGKEIIGEYVRGHARQLGKTIFVVKMMKCRLFPYQQKELGK